MDLKRTKCDSNGLRIAIFSKTLQKKTLQKISKTLQKTGQSPQNPTQ